ncbi:hypothetical protein [Oleispirillum naphthae]|uniref:hypothetical protein n=1 Tax=Oleispirillum naphthae TaxID=2838853 RepID=UPI0030826427
MHWAAQYIGLPWSETGEGPESYHCWSFVRMVEAKHFGRDLPPIPNPGDLLPLARAFRDHPERVRWPRVEVPMEGDCVLLRCARYPVHVGVWAGPAVGGGVLHCAEAAGVVYQRPDALAGNGWKIEGYYRFVGEGA